MRVAEKREGPYRYFTCCDDEEELTFAEMINHAKEKHDTVITAGYKMRRALVYHIHRHPRHVMSFEWKADGFSFYEFNG